MDYLSVEQARQRPGLKLVLTAGVPGPWGEAAKAILRYKALDFLPVAQEAGGENTALRAWTGQDSAPVIVLDEQPPVSHWQDLWLLAERLAPGRPLLPAASAPRVQALGAAALIAGAGGFGWQRRLQLLSPGMAAASPPEPIARMAAKYGWSESAAANAEAELLRILSWLDNELRRQEEAGSEYFIGEGITAVDIYWAHFSGMVQPLPPEDNPMPDYLRTTYSTCSDALRKAVTPRLLRHRDRMFQRHLGLPLVF